MPPLLLYAAILLTLALVLYTVSVWRERLDSQLRTWHLVMFGLGVFADASATWLTIQFVGTIVFTPHVIFSFISLFLMAIHFIWTAFVYINNRQAGMRQFHRFSLFVWSVWILSYLTGFFSGL